MFLGEAPVWEAMDWLQTLPGVGPKVAAAVLNFSTLNRRVLVIDGHVHRVIQRLGLVSASQGVESALRTVMSRIPAAWDAPELMELHVHLKMIGQTACRPDQTHCEACALAGECAHAARLQRFAKPKTGRAAAPPDPHRAIWPARPAR